MNSPTTARDAAVKILMADFADLLKRLEKAQTEHFELQETARLCHTELDGDLQQLGGLVQGVRVDLSKASEAGRVIVAAAQRLENAAVRLEGGPSGGAQRPGAGKAKPTKSNKGASLVFALLLLGVTSWASYATYMLSEQKSAVQVGKATLKAWPALDTAAKRTITVAGSQ
jgi:hypothetical protein